jgi:hypothetical protein
MMYDSKMALAVKANSRVLREIEDAVYIPFGSEYSLLIKNLNSVKALVRVWIDGTEVTDGTMLVVNPNSSLDLERFIKGGNLKSGNKFKFIERTAAISDHRGNKIDDGLIRVEFEFETPRQPVPYLRPNTWPKNYPFDDVIYKGLVGNTSFGATGSQVFTNSVAHAGVDMMSTPTASGATAELTTTARPASHTLRSKSPAPQSEVGITVAGDVSDQKFHHATWFPTDGVKHVMVMRVLGEVEGKQVVEAVTVKTKPVCSSCGKVNKATSKFCAECGTSLQIV